MRQRESLQVNLLNALQEVKPVAYNNEPQSIQPVLIPFEFKMARYTTKLRFLFIGLVFLQVTLIKSDEGSPADDGSREAIPGESHFQDSAVSDINPSCVMYDNNLEDGYNYLYYGPPPELDPANIEILRTTCPGLVERYGHKLCCAPSQVAALRNTLSLRNRIVGNCPSCYYNFRQVFCHLSCSPDQSTFLIPNKTEGKEPNVVITQLDVVIAEDFVQRTFDSCKDVIRESTGVPAMDYLCGEWGAPNCTPRRWFDHLGSPSGGLQSYDIVFRYVKAGEEDSKCRDYEPMNVTTIPCSEVAPGSNSSCSCTDCPNVCSTPPPIVPEPEPTTISGVDTFYAIVPVTASETPLLVNPKAVIADANLESIYAHSTYRVGIFYQPTYIPSDAPYYLQARIQSSEDEYISPNITLEEGQVSHLNVPILELQNLDYTFTLTLVGDNVKVESTRNMKAGKHYT